MDGSAAASTESLSAGRTRARRERLLDMQERLRPYRVATFLILAVALVPLSPEVGWWWSLPLAVGLASMAVADAFARSSERPEIWIAAAWAIQPLLLADGVVVTGGAESPLLMWFALPAVTLGTRFETRGIVAGTTYVLATMALVTFGYDAGSAVEQRQDVIAAVALVLGTVVLSGALVESDHAHRRRSTIDPLTGLANRTALERRLEELDGQLAGPGEPGPHALLLCDLDHFKEVNDQLGHTAGDAVLRDVAYTMRTGLRAGDSIYRVGGEEILVVLPGAGPEAASEIAERLRRSVGARRPAGVEVTVSIGAAVAGPDALESDELMARADAALYAAKAGGRDRVVLGASG